MAIAEITLTLAFADALLYAFAIGIRAMKRNRMTEKENRVALSHNWNKVKYMSYMLVVFFILCSASVGLMMANMLTGMVFGDIPSYINLVLVSILFVNGINLLLLMLKITSAGGANA